ncbi:MAG: hypothetical protein LBF41_02555, partial [Deltaproteobacteria bacterium]|nr:hypothetical protein [Deltaproteobacteria bacterium]
MGDVQAYRGLYNTDVRSLKNTPKSAGNKREGGSAPLVFNAEDMRKGVNLKTGDVDGTGGGKSGAAAKDGSDPGARRAGKALVPKSYLRSISGGNLTEEQKVAKLKKIRDSAKEYEGLLMAEMIKSMRQKPLKKTAGSDTFTEIAEKPFTAALTAAGGLGLADKIIEDVAGQEGLSATLEEHPEIMGANWKMRIAPSKRRKDPGFRNVVSNPANAAPGNRASSASAEKTTAPEARVSRGVADATGAANATGVPSVSDATAAAVETNVSEIPKPTPRLREAPRREGSANDAAPDAAATASAYPAAKVSANPAAVVPNSMANAAANAEAEIGTSPSPNRGTSVYDGFSAVPPTAGDGGLDDDAPDPLTVSVPEKTPERAREIAVREDGAPGEMMTELAKSEKISPGSIYDGF